MPRERTEVRDGKEFRVVTLPQDPRLTPSAAKKRALWSGLSNQEKGAALAAQKTKRKRRRKRS